MVTHANAIPIWFCSKQGFSRCALPRKIVSSYLAFSPLPPFAKATHKHFLLRNLSEGGGIFSVTLSLAKPYKFRPHSQLLTGAFPCRVRTFLLFSLLKLAPKQKTSDRTLALQDAYYIMQPF